VARKKKKLQEGSMKQEDKGEDEEMKGGKRGSDKGQKTKWSNRIASRVNVKCSSRQGLAWQLPNGGECNSRSIGF